MGSSRLVVGFLVVLLTILAFEETSADESFWKGVKKQLGSKKFVELNNGNTVRTSFIKKTIHNVQTKKPTLKQLSSNEEAVFQYLWDFLGTMYKYYNDVWVTGKDSRRKRISSWEEFFEYVRGLPADEDISDEVDNGEGSTQETPTDTYHSFWNDIRKRLGEKFTVKLSTGKIVNVNSLKKIIDNIDMNKTAGELSTEEKAAVQALWDSVYAVGMRFIVNKREVRSWEEFYVLLKLKYGKTLKLIDVIETQLNGNDNVVLDSGDSIPANDFISVLRDLRSNHKPLDELESNEKDILRFAFNLIKNSKRARPVNGPEITSWEELYDAL